MSQISLQAIFKDMSLLSQFMWSGQLTWDRVKGVFLNGYLIPDYNCQLQLIFIENNFKGHKLSLLIFSKYKKNHLPSLTVDNLTKD